MPKFSGTGISPIGTANFLIYIHDSWHTKAPTRKQGFSHLGRDRLCFEGQESAEFEVLFFVGSSVLNIPACSRKPLPAI
jgi:hypothetical protein